MLNNQFFISAEYITRYVTYLNSEERAAATIEKYVRDIRAFADFLGGEAVTKEAAIAWKEHLKTTHEATSINSMIGAINGFFKFFMLDISVKQFKIQHRTFLPTEKELTDDDYDRLLETAWKQKNYRLYYVMQTICATGIRVSELKFITVEAVRKGYTEIENKGKIRTILLPDELTKMLFDYAKKYKIISGSIFITKHGNPLNRTNVWAEMKKLCREAEVDSSRVFPHNLRQRYAVKFYHETKDLSKLADALGHSSVDTTRIYLKTNRAEHLKIINSLGLVRYRQLVM